METREHLKKEILETIIKPVIQGEWYVMTEPFTAESITDALRYWHNVEIPFIGAPILLNAPIVFGSDSHLRVDERQVMMQARESETCLVRNEHIQDGAYGTTDPERRDRNLSIEGGIWKFKTEQRCYTNQEKSMKGSYGCIIFSGVEQVSLKHMIIYDSLESGKGNTPSGYGIQICDCRHFIVEDIDFNDNSRDGVHVNGPASYGHIRHIRGEKMGDDMVALNAWDWDTSSLTFGTIDHLYVEDVECPGNELRLLPGQKVYESGERVDCDIRDIVLENIRGIYTFKLYAQPNISNAIRGTHDVSGTVGTIENVYFKDISFVEVSPSGLNNLPVKSLFEICADCSGIYIEDVYVDNTIDQCSKLDLRLINVGPLSAVWTNGSEDPADWGEVFDPDAICSADDIYLHHISFQGETITEKERLVREVTMTVNPEYPRTVPKGGTGYGKIGKVEVR